MTSTGSSQVSSSYISSETSTPVVTPYPSIESTVTSVRVSSSKTSAAPLSLVLVPLNDGVQNLRISSLGILAILPLLF